MQSFPPIGPRIQRRHIDAAHSSLQALGNGGRCAAYYCVYGKRGVTALRSL
jgi:hypothetical protein